MADPDADDEETYQTVAARASTRFVVRGSEFVGHVAPVETVAAAEAFIEEVRAAHPDATHNVPAYRVRADPRREYASDDGEPPGSAGKPVRNVLRGRDLENVAVVVTRYFGGTELGVGGLVRAYTKATKDAVDAAGVVERRPHVRVRVVVDYDDSGTVRSVLESAGADFEAAYEAAVTFDVSVSATEADALIDRVRSATRGRATVATGDDVADG
ncbi:MAG: YigZ family protein [Halobacteriaceae archaeon]